MRDASIAIIREIGVDTGGSNIQFAVHPETGRLVVIEMNPRVSRSSALASKATGFPIAKIAAKLAVGYTLDEIRNDITRETPACFEPTIDYVVTKIPRFTFEKFPQATRRPRAADEVGRRGDGDRADVQGVAAEGAALARDRQRRLRAARATASDAELRERLRVPNAERLWYIGEAFRARPRASTRSPRSPRIDPWFLRHIDEIIADEKRARGGTALADLTAERAARAQAGRASPTRASRALLGDDRGRRSARARERQRHPAGLQDGRHLRRRVRGAHAVLLLDLRAGRRRAHGRRSGGRSSSSAAARTASGRASSSTTAACTPRFALREAAIETIMVNCNPETVTTDYDTSDQLYFEPLTLEDVLALIDREQPDGRDRAVRRPDAAPARGAARARRRAASSAPAPTRSTAPRTASASRRC